jgi:hypothetical protein
MESDPVKTKYNLEPFNMAIFLSRETWICGCTAPIDIQRLVCFTDGSLTE